MDRKNESRIVPQQPFIWREKKLWILWLGDFVRGKDCGTANPIGLRDGANAKQINSSFSQGF